MLRFTFKRGKQEGIGLVLTEENIRRIRAGEPVLVDCDKMELSKYNPQWKKKIVVIDIVENEAAALEKYKKLIDAKTRVYIDPRLKQ